MATLTTLEKLHDAFRSEIKRQCVSGVEPEECDTGNSIPRRRKESRYRLIVRDGEIRVTPIIASMLRELRKVPEAKLIGEIDSILEHVDHGPTIPHTKPSSIKATSLSGDGTKVLAVLWAMPDSRVGVPIDDLLTQSNLTEAAFVEAFGLLEKHEYVSIERQTSKVLLNLSEG